MQDRDHMSMSEQLAFAEQRIGQLVIEVEAAHRKIVKQQEKIAASRSFEISVRHYIEQLTQVGHAEPTCETNNFGTLSCVRCLHIRLEKLIKTWGIYDA